MRSDRLPRRRFLQAATASAASAAAVSCGRGTASPWRFFTIAEAEIAAAVCDRIIPPDQDPGARAANVVNYLDRQLKGPLKKHQPVYRKGLASLEQASQSRFGKPFPALAASEQDQLLSDFEQNRIAGTKLFFELIRDHTMQGFYGDPRHGGNREYASWRMIGVPPSPVRGRNLYDLSGEGLAARPEKTKWPSNA